MSIHPAAIVDPKSEIDSGARSVLRRYRGTGQDQARHARDGACLSHRSHGDREDNEIHPGAVLGGAPQDMAYKGEETYLRIGTTILFASMCKSIGALWRVLRP